MDTQELKKLLKGSTAVLILDNGEPSFVVLGYDSYKNLISSQDQEVEVKIHPVRSLARDEVASPTEFLDWPKHSQETTLRKDLGGATSYGIGHPGNGKINIPQKFESASPDSNNGTDKFQRRIGEKEAELLEKINKEILALKSEIDKEEKDAVIDG